jgi:hypothetical protein
MNQLITMSWMISAILRYITGANMIVYLKNALSDYLHLEDEETIWCVENARNMHVQLFYMIKLFYKLKLIRSNNWYFNNHLGNGIEIDEL